jgi:hypothetical protein
MSGTGLENFESKIESTLLRDDKSREKYLLFYNVVLSSHVASDIVGYNLVFDFQKGQA